MREIKGFTSVLIKLDVWLHESKAHVRNPVKDLSPSEATDSQNCFVFLCYSYVCQFLHPVLTSV